MTLSRADRDRLMVYTQWKQRLYAFLLRRVLGPYLSAGSLQQLHESIEVSFQEGKFILKDVDLNAAYLTEILSKRGESQCFYCYRQTSKNTDTADKLDSRGNNNSRRGRTR